MDTEKVVSIFLFTVGCENQRWPPQPKNAILAYTDVTNTYIFTVHNINVWVILVVTMHHSTEKTML